MATQVQDILDAAMGKSTKNKPATIATDATELLGVVKRALYKYFAIIARANADLITTFSTVTLGSGYWARPTGAQMVTRITKTTGEEVVVVPHDDRVAETSKPAVYRLGRRFYGAGNALDPSSGDLIFYYAAFPDAPTGLTTVIDVDWPEEFNECLILELAKYLATKDGRADELAGLDSELGEWEGLLVQYCEHETPIERRRFDIVKRFNIPTRVPVK